MTHEKNPAAVALGRAGGKVGGLARVPKGLALVSPERRKAIQDKGLETRRRNIKVRAESLQIQVNSLLSNKAV